MTETVRKISRVVLGVIAGVFSLPALIFGGYFFVCWFRIHTTDVFYVEYPYFLAGCVSLGIGALCAFCTVYAIRYRSFYGLLFIGPLVFGFAMLVYIPNGTPHVRRSMMDDSNYLWKVHSFFRVWYETHRAFPKDQTEFLDALRTGPAFWQNRVQSPSRQSDYGQRGHNLPYEIVIIDNASGPRLNDVSTRPGVIYYFLSEDRQQYWVTMTGLHEDVAKVAAIRTIADRPDREQPQIVTASGKDYR